MSVYCHRSKGFTFRPGRSPLLRLLRPLASLTDDVGGDGLDGPLTVAAEAALLVD